MKLILFGDIPNWNRSIQLLQTYRPDIFIAGLSSVSLGQFASSSVTYTPEETAALYLQLLFCLRHAFRLLA